MKKWKCLVCGQIVEGEHAPDACPLCKAPAEKFVENLLKRDDIRYCPHGRPVMIEMTKKELEKQFKRIV